MARKKVFRQAEEEGEGGLSPTRYQVKAINTWDDIEHDEEDQFFEDRDKVLKDYDEYNEREDSEVDDREVFGLAGVGSEDDEAEVATEGSEDEEEADDEEIDTSAWGSKKQAFYAGDEAEDMDEMKEEEKEALRLQKKKVEAMSEQDFMDPFGLQDWKAPDEEQAEEALKASRKSDDLYDTHEEIVKRKALHLTPHEIFKLLQEGSPELLELLSEFEGRYNTLNKDIVPLIERAQKKGITSHQYLDFVKAKQQLITTYLTNISFYLVLKSSHTRNLREHPVIEALLNIRTAIEKMDTLAEQDNIRKSQANLEELMKHQPKVVTNGIPNGKTNRLTKAKAKANGVKRSQPAANGKRKRHEVIEGDEKKQEEGPIIEYEPEFKPLKSSKRTKKPRTVDNDFGEAAALNAVDLEDKATKKKTLRHYVSKIDQTAAKHKAKFQGDMDLPYKERDKERKARMLAQQGVKQPEGSADLDDEDWTESDVTAAQMLNEADGFYESVKLQKAAKKAAKQAAYENSKMPLIFDDDEDEAEKRAINYQILKNKGLTPHRKKEQRNARVKNRKKFEKKMKHLSSTRSVYKPLQGSYGGEKTGIKTGLARSVKFA